MDQSHHGRQHPVTYVHTGRAGRPRAVIDPDWLRWASGHRSTSAIARFLGLGRTTVQNALLELGLSEPQEAPFLYIDLPFEDFASEPEHQAAEATSSHPEGEPEHLHDDGDSWGDVPHSSELEGLEASSGGDERVGGDSDGDSLGEDDIIGYGSKRSKAVSGTNKSLFFMVPGQLCSRQPTPHQYRSCPMTPWTISSTRSAPHFLLQVLQCLMGHLGHWDTGFLDVGSLLLSFASIQSAVSLIASGSSGGSIQWLGQMPSGITMASTVGVSMSAGLGSC